MANLDYLAPDFVEMYIAVERGFGDSNMEFIEDEKDPLKWLY